jgi:hypothetical protein
VPSFGRCRVVRYTHPPIWNSRRESKHNSGGGLIVAIER